MRVQLNYKPTAERSPPVAIHAAGSITEMAVGLFAVLNPRPHVNGAGLRLAGLCAFVNATSAPVLTPRVFGVKYLGRPASGSYGSPA